MDRYSKVTGKTPIAPECFHRTVTVKPKVSPGKARGQVLRICATMRSTSSTAPALPSMLARLGLAASRWRPHKT